MLGKGEIMPSENKQTNHFKKVTQEKQSTHNNNKSSTQSYHLQK